MNHASHEASGACVLDSCARVHWHVGVRISSYLSCGILGVLAGLALVLWLAGHVQISATGLTVVVVAPLVSFTLNLYVQRVLSGSSRLVLYRHLMAALGTTALGLWWFGAELAVGLDFCVVGLGVFFIFGRFGCLNAGCCHGRPWRRGIRYSEEHHSEGFPAHYVGVRLFPVQLMAAFVHAGLVLAALVIGFRSSTPGEATLLYLTCYSVIRVFMELARGDVRPHLWGVSEAQWTASLILAGCAWMAHGHEARAVWLYDLAVTIAVGLIVAVSWLERRIPPHPWRWRAPDRVRELADGIRHLEFCAGASMATVPCTDTPGGLRLSYTRKDGYHHYCISRVDGDLQPAEARCLATQIRDLGGHGLADMRAGSSPGLFHIRFAADTG